MKEGHTLWMVIREGNRWIEQIRPTWIRLRVFTAASWYTTASYLLSQRQLFKHPTLYLFLLNLSSTVVHKLPHSTHVCVWELLLGEQLPECNLDSPPGTIGLEFHLAAVQVVMNDTSVPCHKVTPGIIIGITELDREYQTACLFFH